MVILYLKSRSNKSNEYVLRKDCHSRIDAFRKDVNAWFVALQADITRLECRIDAHIDSNQK